MLQVSNVSKSFGDNLLFERVSFTLNRGERVGLVGPNGCGKTTLLRIILGEIQPDGGSAWLSPAEMRAGYLAQALEFEPGHTVGQVMKAAIAGLSEAERHLEGLSIQMATAHGKELQQLMAEYDEALEAFERLGGYRIESRADAILDGLDLRALDPKTPVDTLSGGQKTRLGLARLLLSNPDLLLLDEPTNHLDIEALEWLEGFLQGFAGGILIVSHDRTFLDRTVGAILEMDGLSRTVTEYPGTYTDYVEAKAQEQEKQWAAYKDQQAYIARLESTIAGKKSYAQSIELGTIDFGPRKIAKGIARKAVVQQRRIQRLLDSEERIEKPGRSWQMKLEFVDTPSSGRDVLHLEGVTMGFGERTLFRDVNLTLRAGERIALVGPNGSGKTTLARLILAELEPLTGRVRLGAGVKVGYSAQEQEDLDPDSTPFETVRAVAPLNETEARSFLHYFLFGGEEVFQPVGSLSFGERARLALACLVAQGCNFLVLDEPINHLDIPSRSRFEQAMTAFEGTVLAVVHDRYFIEQFATGLWAIEGDGIRAYVDLEDMQRGRQRA
ncbi:MAG TPA: ABC-F family ATP-binding cassette domain-containing protein [Anaerolineae bacterium]|nr:ABC-F family ATP-binding cassette domain-containing protein [Anaerolineae bacterium]